MNPQETPHRKPARAPRRPHATRERVPHNLRAVFQGERELLLQRWGNLCDELQAIDARLTELDDLLAPV